MPNNVPITPPRVPLVDPRTGDVSREWYRFFFSLFTVTGSASGVSPVTSGGTGLSTIPTNGQLLIGNGFGYTLNPLTAGQNIAVGNTPGNITVSFDGILPLLKGGTGASNATDGRTNLGLGTIATQNSNTVAITGGSVNGTTIGATTPSTVAATTVTASGAISATGVAGSPTIDTTAAATTLANNATVDFSDSSGMLIANNHASGYASIYLVGSGLVTVVASAGLQVGAVTYVAGISGYRFTNNSGSSATFGFMFFRTRTTA